MTERDAARVLITGAASGIGAAVAQRFARDGARVALLDIDGAGLERVAERIGTNARDVLIVAADVRSEELVAESVERVRSAFGGLDVAIVNAAVQLVGQDAAVHELSLDAWKKTIGVNLTGAFLTAKYSVRAMLDGAKGGVIVFTGSPTGLRGGVTGFNAYSSSKAGLHGLARVMAIEYAPVGIRVNVVVPGVTETPLISRILDEPESAQRMVDRVPLGRIGTSAEAANVIHFVASDEASFMTGAIVVADGGVTSV